jgi:hypothetical protein
MRHRVRPIYSPKREKLRRRCSRALSIFVFSFSFFFHDEKSTKFGLFTLLKAASMTSISRATRNIFGSVPMIAVHCHRVYLVLYFPSRLCVSFSFLSGKLLLEETTREQKFRAIFLSPFSAAFARLKCLNRLQYHSTPESVDKYRLDIIE